MRIETRLPLVKEFAAVADKPKRRSPLCACDWLPNPAWGPV